MTESHNFKLSIIVPTLNESGTIEGFLNQLQRIRNSQVEILVVDGGSSDGTLDLASGICDKAISSPRGRAVQMNAGVAHTMSEHLLFLHSDTWLPPQACDEIIEALDRGDHHWGRFDIQIESHVAVLKLVARAMNARSRLTGIATGDQAMFVRRDTFDRVGGFPDIPLMEDLALSRALKRVGRPACLRSKVTTSGRRWETRGVLKTILLMWRLRLAYFFGANPFDLAIRYGYVPRED